MYYLNIKLHVGLFKDEKVLVGFMSGEVNYIPLDVDIIALTMKNVLLSKP